VRGAVLISARSASQVIRKQSGSGENFYKPQFEKKKQNKNASNDRNDDTMATSTWTIYIYIYINSLLNTQYNCRKCNQ